MQASFRAFSEASPPKVLTAKRQVLAILRQRVLSTSVAGVLKVLRHDAAMPSLRLLSQTSYDSEADVWLLWPAAGFSLRQHHRYLFVLRGRGPLRALKTYSLLGSSTR